MCACVLQKKNFVVGKIAEIVRHKDKRLWLPALVTSNE